MQKSFLLTSLTPTICHRRQVYDTGTKARDGLKVGNGQKIKVRKADSLAAHHAVIRRDGAMGADVKPHFRVITVDGGELTLEKIAIVGGYIHKTSTTSSSLTTEQYYGGGLLVYGNSAVSLVSCKVVGNSISSYSSSYKGYGGGIGLLTPTTASSSTGLTLFLNDTQITGNTANTHADGGGIAKKGPHITITVSNSSATGNAPTQACAETSLMWLGDFRDDSTSDPEFTLICARTVCYSDSEVSARGFDAKGRFLNSWACANANGAGQLVTIDLAAHVTLGEEDYGKGDLVSSRTDSALELMPGRRVKLRKASSASGLTTVKIERTASTSKFRIIFVNNAELTLEAITIGGGDVTANGATGSQWLGGGIQVYGASIVKLQNCEVKNNKAQDAGAIYVQHDSNSGPSFATYVELRDTSMSGNVSWCGI